MNFQTVKTTYICEYILYMNRICQIGDHLFTFNHKDEFFDFEIVECHVYSFKTYELP